MEQSDTHSAEQQRIHDLEAEVARLRSQTAGVPAARGSRWRSFWSAVCIVVACLLAPLSIVAVWARAEVTDTDRFVATVAPLASDGSIQQAVSDRVATEVLDYINVDQLAADAISTLSSNRDLKPRQIAAITALSGPLTDGIEGFVRDKVDQIVRSDLFISIWNEATTRAHTRLNQALSGDNTGVVSLQGDDVTLDMGQVVEQVKLALVDRGLSVAANIPAVDSQVVIFTSESLGSVQRAYAALNTIGYWLPIVAAVVALLGVVIANHRRRAVLGVGIGLSLSALAAATALIVGRAEYLNALPATVNLGAATSFFDILTFYLRQGLWAALAAGLVLTLGALLTGPGGFARGVRGAAVRAGGAVQAQLASWGLVLSGVRGWVAGNAGGLRIGAVLLAILLVMLTRYKTVELVLWTTAGLLVVLFVIQVLASDDESNTSGGADSSGGPGAGEPAADRAVRPTA